MLVEALLSQLPEETAPAVIVVKPERPLSHDKNSNDRSGSDKLNYDPGMIYVLELATILTLKEQSSLETLGENLASSLHTLVRDAGSLHPLAMSRIIYYLLSLLRLSHVWWSQLCLFFFFFWTALISLGSKFHEGTICSPLDISFGPKRVREHCCSHY